MTIIPIILAALASISARAHAAGSKVPNTVTTLGTLHSTMLTNPKYTLRDFTAAIELYRPDLILNEVRPEHPGPAEGSIDGGIEQSIVYAVAKDIHSTVIPADWFEEDWVSRALKEEAEMTPEMHKKLDPLGDAYTENFKNGSILEVNSRAFQNHKIRPIYKLYDQFGLTASRVRNERICTNIKKALAGQSSRKVMIIFGLDHKYFIDDCIGSTPNQKMVEIDTWLTPQALSTYQVSNTVRENSLQNVRNSQALLQLRLNNAYYNDEFKAKLEKKLYSYSDWILAIQHLAPVQECTGSPPCPGCKVGPSRCGKDGKYDVCTADVSCHPPGYDPYRGY